MEGVEIWSPLSSTPNRGLPRLRRLAETGRIMVRCQDVPPEEAFIGSTGFPRSRGEDLVKHRFVLSHPWLSKSHPDPNGTKLQVLVQQLEMLNASDDDAIFIDYPVALPRIPPVFRLEKQRGGPQGSSGRTGGLGTVEGAQGPSRGRPGGGSWHRPGPVSGHPWAALGPSRGRGAPTGPQWAPPRTAPTAVRGQPKDQNPLKIRSKWVPGPLPGSKRTIFSRWLQPRRRGVPPRARKPRISILEVRTSNFGLNPPKFV